MSVQLQENIRLAPFTTLRIGGLARYFVRAETLSDLQQAIEFAGLQSLPVFILGGGSNLVVSDEGFDGLVLHAALTPSIERTDEEANALFDVSAGTCWDDLVEHTVGQGISGIECLAGIPGLTGGTPVQNVGAYGQEVAQTIDSVSVLDRSTGEVRRMSNAECGFSYRTSIFNSSARDRFLVVGVRFRLSREGRPKLAYADLRRHFEGKPQPSPAEVAQAVRAIRRAKGMLIVEGDPDCRSAGSFFKNPVTTPDALRRIAAAANLSESEIPHWPAAEGKIKLPAAWLIERAGFAKGYDAGPVGISTRHTLALVNRSGSATCGELLAFAATITAGVSERFSMQLEREPVFLGPGSNR